VGERRSDHVGVVPGPGVVGHADGVLEADAGLVAAAGGLGEQLPRRPLVAVEKAGHIRRHVGQHRLDRVDGGDRVAELVLLRLDQDALEPVGQPARHQRLRRRRGHDARLDPDLAVEQRGRQLGRTVLVEVDRGEVGQQRPRPHRLEALGRVGDHPRAGRDAHRDVHDLAQGLDRGGDVGGREALEPILVAGVDVQSLGTGGDRSGTVRGQLGGRDGATGVVVSLATTVEAGFDQHERVPRCRTVAPAAAENVHPFIVPRGAGRQPRRRLTGAGIVPGLGQTSSGTYGVGDDLGRQAHTAEAET
jgi:hypothetical protein